MSKKLNRFDFEFNQIECIVSTPKKTFELFTVTFFEKGRTGKMYENGCMLTVPFAERLKNSILIALNFYLPKSFSCTVRVYPIVKDNKSDNYQVVRPVAKDIAADLASLLISQLYFAFENNANVY